MVFFRHRCGKIRLRSAYVDAALTVSVSELARTTPRHFSSSSSISPASGAVSSDDAAAAQRAQKDNSDWNSDGRSRFRRTDCGESGGLNAIGSVRDSGSEQEQDFGSVNVDEESEDEEDVDNEEGDGSEDDSFPAGWGPFKNSSEGRYVDQRAEGMEGEYRHPLVRETCRLIQLHSTWDPKLESKLRHLLRSLKPRQVCAVLRSQQDERVALRFFYWADRQWRYRHDPIVYSTMLEILSKTKLCQGARRVLRIMGRRGIKRPPEVFRCVMLSYSRAGK
ncbi:hypothetical protein CRG98_047787, partial [Punica granatum]